MKCVICLSSEGTDSYRREYGCLCQECWFHEECFRTYQERHKICPICRAEEVLYFDEREEDFYIEASLTNLMIYCSVMYCLLRPFV